MLENCILKARIGHAKFSRAYAWDIPVMRPDRMPTLPTLFAHMTRADAKEPKAVEHHLQQISRTRSFPHFANHHPIRSLSHFSGTWILKVTSLLTRLTLVRQYHALNAQNGIHTPTPTLCEATCNYGLASIMVFQCSAYNCSTNMQKIVRFMI